MSQPPQYTIAGDHKPVDTPRPMAKDSLALLMPDIDDGQELLEQQLTEQLQ